MPFYIRVPSLIPPVYCITQTEEPKVFLVSEKKKICQNAIIESIQINKNGKNSHRRRIPIREIKDSEISLKFDKEGQRGLDVYLVISE